MTPEFDRLKASHDGWRDAFLLVARAFEADHLSIKRQMANRIIAERNELHRKSRLDEAEIVGLKAEVERLNDGLNQVLAGARRNPEWPQDVAAVAGLLAASEEEIERLKAKLAAAEKVIRDLVVAAGCPHSPQEEFNCKPGACVFCDAWRGASAYDKASAKK